MNAVRICSYIRIPKAPYQTYPTPNNFHRLNRRLRYRKSCHLGERTENGTVVPGLGLWGAVRNRVRSLHNIGAVRDLDVILLHQSSLDRMA